MKKFFTMLLILGICASNAFSHSPPGLENDSIQEEKFEVLMSKETATIENYSVGEVVQQSIKQDLSFGNIVVSNHRETRRSSAFHASKWRVDRSRCYRCTSSI